MIASEDCALGCFEDEPRCRSIDPSNGLGAYLDMVEDAPDVELTDAFVNTATGAIEMNNSPVTVPSFLIEAPNGGVAVRVFVVNSLTWVGGTVRGGDYFAQPGPAAAFVAKDAIRLEGTIRVDATAGSAYTGCATPGSGGAASPQTNIVFSRGGGGGGHATDGSAGGAITMYSGPQGSTKGLSSGTASLVPLRGGCSGGFQESMNGTYPSGGGAIQFSSGRSITVTGTIDVRGQDGLAEQVQFDRTYGLILGGGGAGGGVLLEAPNVTFMGATQLRAAGGAGASGCAVATDACSHGGAGATSTTPAGSVTAITGNAGGGQHYAGGGGGGLGRVRINTRDGSYEKSSQAIEDASLTASTIMTR